MPPGSRLDRYRYALYPVEHGAVASIDGCALKKHRFNMLQLHQTDRRLYFVHLAIDARGNNGQFVGEAKILQEVDSSLRLGVGTDYRATFKRCEHLSRMKAENRQIAVP